MAVFKPKKTYIKRYASKNIDKKIKFADNVTAEFGLGGKKAKTSVSSAKTDAIKAEKATHMHIGETKPAMSEIGYRPKYKFTSIEGDGLAHFEESASSSTYEKTDIDDTIKIENSDIASFSDAEAVIAESENTEEKISKPFEQETTEIEPSDKEYLPQETEIAHPDENADDAEYEFEIEEHTAIALAEKPVEDEASETDESEGPEENDIEPKEKNADKQEKPKRNVFSVVMTIVAVMAVIAGGGYLGKDFINAQIERTRAISEELAVMYAPEDYVYPEIPSGVAQKVKAARDAAYREAMANAYVPKRAEVPNLYKYDYVKTCYLTFDDGPSAEVTSSILDTLKKYNVPATFFVVGKNAEQYPELIKRMDAEGHSIGNHSYSHNYEYMYSGDSEFDSEMIACKNAINNILGRNYGNMLYRFPGGSFEVYKQYYIWNIESEGYQYVDWNSLTGDSEVQNPDAEYIMNALKESTINGTVEDIVVLMHDAGAKKITADTLPQVIEYLRSKNYVFKAVKNSGFISE